jgi:SAM-dependent methyltransferase
MDNDAIRETRPDRGMPRGAPSNRPLLPLDAQDAYRDRYRAMRPGWRSSGEQLEALVRSHLTAQSHVLDLGCGRGGLVELFWRDVKLAVGLDPDLPSLVEHRAQGMPVIGGRGEQIPFAGQSFDLVVCLWVLEHLERPEMVFGEVRRVLKPGGHFVFLTPNLRNPLLLMNRLAKPLPQLQRRIVPRLYGRTEADTFPVRYRANTEASIRALAMRCGLEVAELRAIADPTYLALNDLMFRASVMADRLLPPARGVHLLGDLTLSAQTSRAQ